MESKNSEESGQVKGKDVDLSLKISFEQSCSGCISELTYYKNYFCTVCSGRGVEPNSEPVKCKTCEGLGTRTNSMGTHSVKCTECEGLGSLFYKCESCMGLGFGKLQCLEKIVVPKGVYDGVTLRIKNKGNETVKGISGDLLIKLKVEPSKYFVREGDNLILDKKISVC